MRKPYHQRIRFNWWLVKRPYLAFMLREMTALFIGAYGVLLLYFLWVLRQRDPSQYAHFIAWLQSPASMVFHALALTAALYNSVTTFNAMPQVMSIRRGEEKVAPMLLVLPNYLLLIVVSAGVVWLLTQ